MEKIADFFTHLGWAFWGVECDCGYNPFNGFARIVARYLPDADYDLATDDYVHWWQRLIFKIGQVFYDIGVRLYWPPEHTD